MWATDEAEALTKDGPEAHVVLLEHTGHLLFADEPVRFVEFMETFLRGARPKSRRKK